MLGMHLYFLFELMLCVVEETGKEKNSANLAIRVYTRFIEGFDYIFIQLKIH